MYPSIYATPFTCTVPGISFAFQVRIQSWLNSPRDNKLILRYHGTEIIGRGVIRGSTTVEDMSNA
ncbi:hypothetical protein ACT453_33410, partial [Bacillus sp. D-CC]